MKTSGNRGWASVVWAGALAVAALLGGCGNATGSEDDIDSVDLAICTGVKLNAPTPAPPQDAGTMVSLQATGATCAGGETPEYRFTYMREGTTTLVEIQGWSAASAASWNTTGLPSGKYLLYAYARHAGGSNFESIAYGSYLINGVCTSTTLSAAPAPPQTAGTPVTLTASGTCTSGSSPEYRFFYYPPTGGGPIQIQPYGASPANWNTTGLPDGKYTLLVMVRAQGNTSSYEGYVYGSYELGDGGCTSASMSANPASPQVPGTVVTLTGNSTCASGTPQYRFYYDLAGGGTTWVLIQDWSGSPAVWSTAGLPAGTHTLRVDVRKVGNTTVDSTGYQGYTLGSESWSTIAVGMGYHTCGVVSDGTGRCWGSNSDGQIGDGSTVDRSSPRVVTGLTGATVISPGGFHTCARRTDGSVRCWGANTDGQLGTGNTSPSTTAITVPGISDAIAITSGTYHSCALRSGGTVSCWGDNAFGQIGNGAYGPDALSPTTVVGISGATAVSAGGWHTCALVGTSVYCWGLNDHGQIGTGSTNDKELTPLLVNVTSVSSLSAGDSHTCVTRSAGDARCWGLNDSGQLGNGTTTDSSVPVAVSGMSGATSISGGYVHSCARRNDGTVRCWGNNDFGELGNNTTTSQSTPATVTGVSTAVSSVASGGVYSCAKLSNGTAQCWGYNVYGQLGTGNTTDSLVPVSVISP